MRLRINWRFPWVRPSHDHTAAPPREARHQRRGPPSAPILELARDWLAAWGARQLSGAPDVVAGKLPSGKAITYTTSAQFARTHAEARFLAPGSAAGDELLAEIASSAKSALRIPTPAGQALAVARSAITVLDARRVAAQGSAEPDHQMCPECLERDGRVVIVGIADGVRDLRAERQRERTTIEAAVTLSVRTPRGLREEVVRFTVDAASGAALPPLRIASLRAAEHHATPTLTDGELDRARSVTEISTQRAAKAAGRLARLQGLADYHRRQSDIAQTAERLLVETPDEGRAILAARQSELDRLAASHGVTVASRVRAWTPIIETVAGVRVALRRGGAFLVEVDLARQRVEPPRCQCCDEPWRVGAQCAEGHVTCMSCQHTCTHCGERHCPRCAAPALAPCATCGAPSCARCARNSAGGRHRTFSGAHKASITAIAGAAPPDGGAHDLSAADMDAMTPATWQFLVRWYLEAEGYRILGETADDEAATVSFECRSPDGSTTSHAQVVTSATGAWPSDEDRLLLRRLTGESKRRPNSSLVAVTRLDACHVRERYASLPHVHVVDRAALLAAARRQAGAFGQARQRTEGDMDDRARAALAVQQSLHRALQAAIESLTTAASGVPVGGDAPATTTEGVEIGARTLRQVLLACETLADDWTGLFAATPTRANALGIEQDVAAIERLAERASHLSSALRQATEAWETTRGSGARAVQRWRAALGEESARHCQLIASKLSAIIPTQWRDFEAAHLAGAPDSIAASHSAWQRAGLRARRLRDECEQTATEPAPHPAPRS